ncbi:L-rhamnose mutarotase [Paraburkholderia caffeinilytica]|uniref:L-rhamnose mutarotase n=1 Tax=Paraburkholderia caffeinilytica TaxID=1761016 RepID=UPI0038B82283
MPTTAFRMILNPGMQAEYQRRHDAIWPELVEALKAAGACDYSIFLDPETHHLFAVLKHPEQHGMNALPALDVVRRWWDHMADIMATESDHTPCMTPLTLVFHLP